MHRFGPSGPWPWTSFYGGGSHQDIPSRQTTRGQRPLTQQDAADEENNAWKQYPTSLFPNWTDAIMRRSGLQADVLEKEDISGTNVRTVDMLATGHLRPGPSFTGYQLEDFWKAVNEPAKPEIRLTCYFVEDISGPIMQMLGTSYDIEPFFFSSAINGIATRYQEDMGAKNEDHITITLPFLRAIDSATYNKSSDKKDDEELEEVIDVQTPLALVSPDGQDQTLLLDVLAVHLIRAVDESTLIVIHPESAYWLTTSAAEMQERVLLAAKGVYWANLLQESKDPTFMLLILLWHALYAWDEAMEVLYEHICYLERRAMIQFNASDIWLTRELHIIRAMLLHYETLLKQFHKTVRFVLHHPNHTLEHTMPDHEERDKSNSLLRKECYIILDEIERLQDQKEMQEYRVKNVMDLVFSTLSVRETETSLSQGWVMQQLSYVTMAFLPATFVATVFGMNLTEFTPDTNLNWRQYIAATIPLSFGTVWIMLALQKKMNHPSTSFFVQLLWPCVWLVNLIDRWRRRGFLHSGRTVVVDPTLNVDFEMDEDSLQEDGKTTSRARVTRYWGWRPKRREESVATSSTAGSRPGSPLPLGLGLLSRQRSRRSEARQSIASEPPLGANAERFIEAYNQQQEKPWGKTQLRRIFGGNSHAGQRPGRANTLDALQR
ncbi:hypothetical protein AURDEDRAFT_89906 [Auricularia subglabra TFB-10046 SS5]|nr:hypothetical protein AURDEDRAFT_89906 [Auricularia subglabra TFB-10046 SS5]